MRCLSKRRAAIQCGRQRFYANRFRLFSRDRRCHLERFAYELPYKVNHCGEASSSVSSQVQDHSLRVSEGFDHAYYLCGRHEKSSKPQVLDSIAIAFEAIGTLLSFVVAARFDKAEKILWRFAGYCGGHLHDSNRSILRDLPSPTRLWDREPSDIASCQKKSRARRLGDSLPRSDRPIAVRLLPRVRLCHFIHKDIVRKGFCLKPVDRFDFLLRWDENGVRVVQLI